MRIRQVFQFRHHIFKSLKYITYILKIFTMSTVTVFRIMSLVHFVKSPESPDSSEFLFHLLFHKWNKWNMIRGRYVPILLYSWFLYVLYPSIMIVIIFCIRTRQAPVLAKFNHTEVQPTKTTTMPKYNQQKTTTKENRSVIS